MGCIDEIEIEKCFNFIAVIPMCLFYCILSDAGIVIEN